MALMSHHKDSRGDVSLHHVVANLTGQVKLSLDIIIMSLLLSLSYKKIIIIITVKPYHFYYHCYHFLVR